MEATNLLLSAEELQLVQDTHWLLTKNNIIEKAKLLFGGLAAELQQMIEAKQQRLPETVQLFSPKVFKGEYYQGLPYVMLDYPRIFSKEDVFAIRTMFWWGNFFSVTLQLKGSYLKTFGPALSRNRRLLAEQGFHIAVSGDEWRHDFEPDNYQPLAVSDAASDALHASHDFPSDGFLKLAVRIPLSGWNNAMPVIAKYHRTLIDILA